MKKATLVKVMLLASMLGFTAFAQAVTITATTITPANGITNTGGAIDITVTGGSSSYKYTWSNQAWSEDLTGLSAGNYTVTVNDNGASYTTATFTIGYTQESYDLIANTSISKCKEYTKDITTQANSNIASYLWSDNSTMQYGVARTAGKLYVTATFTSGMKAIDSIDVVNNVSFESISVYMGDITNINAWPSVTYNPPLYRFSSTCGTESWSMQNQIFSINWNKKIGIDTLIKITDNLCCDTIVYNIQADPNKLVATSVITPANGLTNLGGAIDITISGGTAPYQMVWNQQSTSEDLSNIATGKYSVTVYDSKQNSIVKDFTVGFTNENYTLIDKSKTYTKICRNINPIEVPLTSNLDIIFKSFLWSNGSTAQNLLTMSSGKYFVTATVITGLQIIDSVTIHDQVLKTETSVLFGDTTNFNNAGYNYVAQLFTGKCGSMNGSIYAGAYHIKQFIWNRNIGIDTLILIGDSFSCNDTIIYYVNNNPDLLSIVGVKVTPANGLTNYHGAIDITVIGGKEPYSYEWSYGTTSQDLSDIGVGTYSVTVYDSNQRSATQTFKVGYTAEKYTLIDKSIKYTRLCNSGYVEVPIIGNGINVKTFLWSNGLTTSRLSTNRIGKYFTTVTLNSGLILVDSVTIDQEVLLKKNKTVYFGDTTNFSLNSTHNLTKYSERCGTSEIVYLAGSFEIANIFWNKKTGIDTLIYLSLLSPDASCNDTTIFTIEGNPNKISIVTNKITPANGLTNLGGAIDMSAIGGKSPYTYVWNNQKTNEDLTNISAGTYSVTVYDSKQLSTTASFNVGYTQEPIEIIANTTQHVCDGYNTDIMAIQNANITSYIWNDGSTKNFILAKNADKYFVTATFKSGMIAKDSIELIVDKVTPVVITSDASVIVGSTHRYDFTPKETGVQYVWNIRTSGFGTITKNTDNSTNIAWGSKTGTTAIYLNSYKNQCVHIDSIIITVKAKPADTLSITGTVKAGSAIDVDGNVSIFSETDSITPIQTVTVNPNGVFEIDSLVLGNYKLMATPNTTLASDFAATYYARSLSFAKAFSLTVDGDVSGIDIVLITGTYTGIDVLSNGIQLYPNPAKSHLNISIDEQVEQIILYSIDGKLLIQSSEKTINISQLESGTYRAVVITKSKTSSFAFVKE